MIVFFEGFQIQTYFSEPRQLWFCEIMLADTDFHFCEYEGYANSEFGCLFNSLKACLLICQEQSKPEIFLPAWILVEDGEF